MRPPDVGLTSQGNDLLLLYRNTSTQGAVSFATRLDEAVGDGPDSVIFADLDGNGSPEVLIGNVNGHNLSLFSVSSSGFGIDPGSRVDIGTDWRPESISVSPRRRRPGDVLLDRPGGRRSRHLAQHQHSRNPTLMHPKPFGRGRR